MVSSFGAVPDWVRDWLGRCRSGGLGGEALGLRCFSRAVATAGSGVGEDTSASTQWQEAETRASALPEDLQAVFLFLARAAIERAPCPSDAQIAKVYGTVSTGRARRLLAWFEDQNLLVLRADGMGRRVLTFIGSGWETLPGVAEG